MPLLGSWKHRNLPERQRRSETGWMRSWPPLPDRGLPLVWPGSQPAPRRMTRISQRCRWREPDPRYVRGTSGAAAPFVPHPTDRLAHGPPKKKIRSTSPPRSRSRPCRRGRLDETSGRPLPPPPHGRIPRLPDEAPSVATFLLVPNAASVSSVMREASAALRRKLRRNRNEAI